MIVIEMNPRVSRSSALASKATGFPIAKIAAKLAVGYTLDEIQNDITRVTPVSFEPTLDYCVVKIPRFTFEKFSGAEPVLSTQMKSVGEAMSIGRTFKEALQKCLRSLEIGSYGFEDHPKYPADWKEDKNGHIWTGTAGLFGSVLLGPHLAGGHRYKTHGVSLQMINDITAIDPWFLHNLKEIMDLWKTNYSLRGICRTSLRTISGPPSRAGLFRPPLWPGYWLAKKTKSPKNGARRGNPACLQTRRYLRR